MTLTSINSVKSPPDESESASRGHRSCSLSLRIMRDELLKVPYILATVRGRRARRRIRQPVCAEVDKNVQCD